MDALPTRVALVAVLLLVAGCARSARPERPGLDGDFAGDLLEAARRAEANARPPAKPVRPARSTRPTNEAKGTAVRDTAAELASVFAGLDHPDQKAIAAMRGEPWFEADRTTIDFVFAAWARHPAVAAARHRFAAARQRFDQARYLEEIVSRFRTFTRTAVPKLGPKPTGLTRPEWTLSPYPAVGTLRERLAARDADVAWERLRAAVVEHAARTIERVAACRFVWARIDLADRNLTLLDEFERVVRGRVSAGEGRQADLLRVQAVVAEQRLERTVLDAAREEADAALNAALARAADASLRFAPEPAVAEAPALAVLIDQANTAEPKLAAARADVKRRDAALALGQIMVTAQVDLGSARVERGKTAEGGVARPDGSKAGRPAVGHRRSRFGPARAFLDEIRYSREGAVATERAVRASLPAAVGAARRAWVAARETRVVHEESLLPLARTTFQSLRGAYAGRRAAFLDVFEAARRLLDVELELARARRDESRAVAAVLQATGRWPSR